MAKVTVYPMGDSSRGGGYRKAVRKILKAKKFEEQRDNPNARVKIRGGRGKHNYTSIPKAAYDLILEFRERFKS